MFSPIRDWSRILHNIVFCDADQSLCARAWQRRNEHWLWAAWVLVFTPSHCERSNRFHRAAERKRAKPTPNDLAAKYHTPMPVILSEDDYGAWLHSEPDDAAELLRPFEGSL